MTADKVRQSLHAVRFVLQATWQRHKQLGKDVVHNVLAVVIVVQQQVSQPMHRTVMLPEQPLDMSFSVCHTLYIHTETDFLNPQMHFF